MKTKEKKERSVMKQLRDIRDKLSSDIKGMSYSELREYLEEQKGLRPASVWRKQTKASRRS